MGPQHLEPAGTGGHRSEHLTQRGMVTGFSHSAPPRRGHSRLLRADLGGSARSLCSRPDYISPPSRGGRTLSKRRDDLRGGLWPELVAEPWRLRQSPCPHGRPERSRDDAVFQPYNADHHGLRRHRCGRSTRPQLGQFGSGPRAILPRDYGCPPRDAGTRRPTATTSTMIETMLISVRPGSLAQRLFPVLRWLPGYRRDWLLPDVLAGLAVWAVMVREGMAYAGIVGVPPIMGLYTIVPPLIVYALLGTSRLLVVGPDT